MSTLPSVSVIVPCYNKAPFVAQTLDSVLCQTGVALDVVVVDDRSTDGSWDVIRRYGDRVRAVRMESNSGSTVTRNHGASLATGDYLMFLDGDDMIGPGTLAALAAALAGTSRAVAACVWHKLHPDGDGWTLGPAGKPLAPPADDPVAAWLGGWYFPPCSILWPRAVFESTGGWHRMGPWDDRDIMLRALIGGVRIVLATGGEAVYRILDEGTSLRSLPTRDAEATRLEVLDRAARHAAEAGLAERYRRDLGAAYYRLARTTAAHYPDLVLECLSRADRYLGRKPLHGSPFHRLLWRVLGLERKERWMMRLGLRRADPVRSGGSGPGALQPGQQ